MNNDNRTFVENTRQRDPFVHLLGAMSEGTSGYIEGMEADGQRQVVHSDLLPTDAPWSVLESFGFVKGEPADGDDLFTHCTLPEGWRREGSDHAMHSYVLDERGVRRVNVFYKAAFYDRRADAHLLDAGYDAATHALYGDEPAALPELWPVFTDAEKATFWESVDAMQADIDRSPSVYGDRQAKVDALNTLRVSA